MSLRAKKALGTLGRTFRKAISTPDPTYEDDNENENNSEEVLTEEILNRFIDAFIEIQSEEGEIDKNNPSISIGKLEPLLRTLGQNPTWLEMEDLKLEVKNEKGKVELIDFLILMTRRLRDTNPAEEIKEAFQFFDRDGNGLLSTNELKNAMKLQELNDALIDQFVELADKDKDGHVNYEEFVNAMST